jgi:hypothetical protein
MSPDSIIGALHLFDRWALLLRGLAGEPLPALPEFPDRVHRLPEPPTVEADAEHIEAEEQAALVWRALADDSEGLGP